MLLTKYFCLIRHCVLTNRYQSSIFWGQWFNNHCVKQVSRIRWPVWSPWIESKADQYWGSGYTWLTTLGLSIIDVGGKVSSFAALSQFSLSNFFSSKANWNIIWRNDFHNKNILLHNIAIFKIFLIWKGKFLRR